MHGIESMPSAINALFIGQNQVLTRSKNRETIRT